MEGEGKGRKEGKEWAPAFGVKFTPLQLNFSRTKTDYKKRSFAVNGPVVWTMLLNLHHVVRAYEARPERQVC